MFFNRATGFLGAHILKSILDDTQATVYCLVRETGNDYAEKRLIKRLKYYFGNRYNSLFNRRIFVLSGDITLEKFGFDNNRYVDLSKKVDVVIHAAAIVKHFGNYSEFENINIKGTQKIIDFCMLSGARLNHISTISISGDLFEQKNKGITFTEKDFCVGQNIGDNVYVKSKFIAEKKIFEAVNKGLNASIYRVGNLTGRYSDGFFQNNIDDNRFYNMLKFFISVGTIPNDIYYREVELTPVDICAKVILELAKLDNGQISVFHVYNNKNVIMKEIIAVFNSFGKNVIVVDNKSYQEYIEKIINDDTKNKMLIKVINDLYKDSINNTASFVEVSCKITEEILRRLGINWPDINKEYLEKVFKHMKKIGFIS